MKPSGRCPKCGSQDIIADAKAVDRNDAGWSDSTIATYAKPDALIFRERQTTAVSAWVCAECGLVEYYADDPKAIKLPD
ncbi:MAG: hypothetical protein H0X66_06755 [Verrucomicrobia bacterium]|nr:hypothetical protein [Verrucomicrobiota bacterium]